MTMYQLLDKAITQELQNMIKNLMKNTLNNQDNDNDITKLINFQLKKEYQLVKRNIFNKEIREILSKDINLSLNEQVCKKLTNKKIWNFIAKSRISSLILQYCKWAHILKEIGQNQVQFPILKILNLQGNKINSIQYLPFQKMKILQNLNLKNNQISNMNSFAKVNLRCLRELRLENNYCHTLLSKLSRANLQSRRRKAQVEVYFQEITFQLIMDYDYNHEYFAEEYKYLIMEQDMSSVMKLSLQSCLNLTICQFQRIYQNKISVMFIDRFGDRLYSMHPQIQQQQEQDGDDEDEEQQN